jgi:hypothetical protein
MILANLRARPALSGMDDMFHRMLGFINMVQRTVLQAAGARIVFFSGKVVVGPIQQL